MSASSSIQTSHNGDAKLRNRTRRADFDWPSVVPCITSSPESPEITDEALNLLARQIAQLDVFVLDVCAQSFKLMAEQDTDLWAGLDKVDFQRELITIQLAQRQFLRVEGGERAFGMKYLEDQAILLFWYRSVKVLLALYHSQHDGNAVVAVENSMQLFRRGTSLPELVARVGSAGLLSDDIRKTVRERYLKLEDVWTAMSVELSGRGFTHTSWQDISKQLEQNNGQQGLTSRLTPSWTIATTLWILFVTTTVTSVPFSFFAYHYSSHEPGTVQSSDFWFLLQGCVTQLFGIWTMGLSLDKERMGFLSRVLPLLVATLATVGAPVVHVFAPSEWSDFMVWVGAAVQGFFALQIAISLR